MQVDRASVWRSAPLRRGALVMAVLPGRDRGHHRAALGLAGPADRPGRRRLRAALRGQRLRHGRPRRADPRGPPDLGRSCATGPRPLVIMEFAGLTVAGALVVGAVRADGAPTASQLTALVARAGRHELWRWPRSACGSRSGPRTAPTCAADGTPRLRPARWSATRPGWPGARPGSRWCCRSSRWRPGPGCRWWSHPDGLPRRPVADQVGPRVAGRHRSGASRGDCSSG